jgi:two-component system cell cycle sensor histidine kinase/response regulator CckA
MIVDDEAPVRDVESRMLSQAGYDVMTVDEAGKAIQIIRDTDDIALVIADVHMPEMNGDEMARHIRAIRPDLKILFVTGFSDTLFTNQPVLWNDQAFLDKPFTRQGLLEAVSLLLNGRIASNPHVA